MVDLDCGTHYDLFKVYHPRDRRGLTSFQLSFKEVFALVSVSLFLIRVLGGVVSATALVS